MIYYVAKFGLSALLIVLISEVSKRNTFIGGLLASLPLVSFLSMIWLYVETKDAGKIAELSTSIFWLVLPSLALFLALPGLLRFKWNFYLALTVSTGIMMGAYLLTVFVVKKAGFPL